MATTMAMGMAVVGCEPGEPAPATEADSGALSGVREKTWPTGDIRVCWESFDPAFAAERAWVQDQVTTTWQAHSAVRLTDWGRCAAPSEFLPDDHIRIQTADEWPHTSGIGTDLRGVPGAMVLNFSDYPLSLAAPFGRQQGPWSDGASDLAGDFDGDGASDVLTVFDDDGARSFVLHARGAAGALAPAHLCTRQGRWADDQRFFSGDFDGDGRPDVAAVFEDRGHLSIDLHANQGGGTLALGRWATRIAPWDAAAQVVAADFDGDGRLDLAVFHDADGQIAIDVYRNDGHTFQPLAPATWQGAFSAGRHVLAGDFDGDGRDDLAVVFDDQYATSIQVYASTGNGGFAPARWATQQTAWRPDSKWLAGDFDADGRVDLVEIWRHPLSPGYSDTDIDLHRSNGAAFGDQRWGIRKGPWQDAARWVAADFTGDRTLDLVKVWRDGDQASVDLVDGARDANHERNVRAVAAHEFGHALGFTHEQNRDDTPFGCRDSHQGTNPDATFTAYDPQSIMNYCAIPVNNDGRLSALDVQGLQRTYGPPPLFDWFHATRAHATFTPAPRGLIADFDGDGRSDVAVASREGQDGLALDVYLHRGAGQFLRQRWAVQPDAWSASMHIVAGDFNGDGRGDLAVVSDDRGYISIDVYRSTGKQFQMQHWQTRHGAFDPRQRWTSTDFDGDGALDLIGSFQAGGSLIFDLQRNVSRGAPSQPPVVQ